VGGGGYLSVYLHVVDEVKKNVYKILPPQKKREIDAIAYKSCQEFKVVFGDMLPFCTPEWPQAVSSRRAEMLLFFFTYSPSPSRIGLPACMQFLAEILSSSEWQLQQKHGRTSFPYSLTTNRLE
jgi:hypothetical protein